MKKRLIKREKLTRIGKMSGVAFSLALVASIAVAGNDAEETGAQETQHAKNGEPAIAPIKPTSGNPFIGIFG
ncbi:hypothetical protein [Pseudoalteromonas rubra]|uniref:Uncharacterized protein n=1 Tax=Pseudoalteromonas rubra TaxID=43658 RepID=A0A5S3X7H1_9GAMM|nr:hypothetical protein [Pseudoalteromonas rubra]TMP39703.1 hypothetical protein CWB98_03700 [Pseudoalteromonas rubra]